MAAAAADEGSSQQELAGLHALLSESVAINGQAGKTLANLRQLTGCIVSSPVSVQLLSS
jgi:hypothetical protein